MILLYIYLDWEQRSSCVEWEGEGTTQVRDIHYTWLIYVHYVHTVLYYVHNVLYNAHIGGGGVCDRGKNISSSYLDGLDINFWSEFLSFRPSNYLRGFHQFPCLFYHIIKLFSHISIYTMLAIAKRLNDIGWHFLREPKTKIKFYF